MKSPGTIYEILPKLNDYQAVIVSGIEATLRNGIVKACIDKDIDCYFIPHTGDVIIAGAKHLQSFSIPIMSARRAVLRPEYAFAKRTLDALLAALGLVIASPVYYASANATLIACLDRLFYSTPFDKTMKVGASVACARRGGCSATFDELNKYFTNSGMPVASSQYWNSIHGRTPGEAEQDGEGRQTMRTLARNMTFLMRSIALGKAQFGLPEREARIATHFIR